jgi:hypothetical protein
MPVCPCGRCARGDLRAVDEKLTKISFFTASRTPTQQNSTRILEGKATRPPDLAPGQAQLCATAAVSAGSAECERRSRLAPHSEKTKIPQILLGFRSPISSPDGEATPSSVTAADLTQTSTCASLARDRDPRKNRRSCDQRSAISKSGSTHPRKPTLHCSSPRAARTSHK